MGHEQYIFILILCYFLSGLGILAKKYWIKSSLLIGFSILLNLIGLAYIFYAVTPNENSLIHIPWLSVGDSSIALDLLYDNATWLMLFLVQFIALGVQVFSLKYMETDPRKVVYYAFLNLFIGSMLGLVVAGNLLLIFVFWELVGFCSYLLIGFWYDKQSATEAATKAFMVNKVGDSFLLIGIGLLYAATGSLEINTIAQALAENPTLNLIPVASLLLFLGSLAKSAQLPLQVWLPDAMEGPTPVSALIHAATMVAAGIFLLARFHFLLTDFTLLCITITGAVTAFLAGYSAIFQWDIKKILAYSTISQLGMMMVAIGLGHPDLALFHLFTHAFFKAGLFLIAGALIHYVHHEQDIRKLGALTTNRNILKIAFFICAASLAGLPLFSGYLSKETILLSTLDWSQDKWFFDSAISILFIISSLFTGVYITKIAYYVFLQPINQKEQRTQWGLMEIIIVLLAILSLALPHSLSLFEAQNAHFANYFEIPEVKYHGFGYLIVILSLACMYASFVFFKKGKLLTHSRWAKLGYQHFYIDLFYKKYVLAFFIGKKINEDEITPEGYISKLFQNDTKRFGMADMVSRFDAYIVDGFTKATTKLTLLLSQLSSWNDQKVIDGAISFITNLVDNTGNRLRRLQGGKLQEYLTATVLILIFTAIVANLL